MGISIFTLLLEQINVDEATPGLQKVEGGMPFKRRCGDWLSSVTDGKRLVRERAVASLPGIVDHRERLYQLALITPCSLVS
jgi:hypothetical protein